MDIQAYIQNGIIESYVLGIVTAEERAEVEKLMLQHPEVQQAINEFSEALEVQAIQNAVAPPVGVKEKLLQSLGQENKRITGNASTNGPTRMSVQQGAASIRLWRFAAAASIILLAVSAYYNFDLYNRYNDKKEQYQALLLERNSLQANNNIYETKLREWQSAAAMMADPAMAMIKMPGVKGKEANMATIFWDTRTKDVYVLANKLPVPSTKKQYQLWAIVDGKPVDAGMLDPACTSVCKMKNIPRAEMFAITLEDEGGHPAPLGQMFVMGKV